MENKNLKIKIVLKDRLGNQMFQYALGYSLSLKYNCELCFGNINKIIIDKIFNIKLSIKKLNCDKRIDEKTNEYNLENKSQLDNLESGSYLINGYWQDENYFKDHEKEIRELYEVPRYKISDKDLIIHVRRGDYITNPKFKKDFFYCDLDWYKRALSYFNFDKLHIVSDDTKWCKKAFAEYDPIIPDLEEKSTLGYISSFNNIIISNSSFGWWGAYLSKSSNVIYPKIWYPRNTLFNPGLDIWKGIS